MKYLFAIITPPFAILACKKPIQFTINLILWIISLPLLFVFGIGIFVWLFCTAHALIVCLSSASDKKLDRIVHAIEGRNVAGSSPPK